MIIKFAVKVIVSVFTAIAVVFGSIFSFFFGVSTVKYKINASELGKTIPNMVSNVNVWDMATQFYNCEKNTENDIFEFVDYIQLMQCSGGNAERDLFKDPYDTSNLTDYDFSRLIKNCKGILKLGAKPHLKFGSVPMKLTTDYKIGEVFGMNIYPPDNYNQYYEYIKAIAQALVDEFGVDEVKTWHFGCMTEYENTDWFIAKSGKAKDSKTAYFKLYDYTVQALIDVIGEDIYVGAHCMSVTEGLWDERTLLKHVTKEKNYATGKKGTKIDYISASFYDSEPGVYTSGYSLPEMIKRLKKSAKKYGLDDLKIGVDEGRILSGNTRGTDDSALLSRTVGYTWQAAYDARLFKQGIDSSMDYISSWDFFTNGLIHGIPAMTYHFAKNISAFAGSRQLDVSAEKMMARFGIESDCLAGWNDETQTLRIMAYNFKNDVAYDRDMKLDFTVKVPQLDGKEVQVVKYLLNDDCNFFDEWVEDRKTYNITDDCFSWSPDDPTIESPVVLQDSEARNLLQTELLEKYKQCAELKPVYSTAIVKNGKLKLSETIGGGNVVFYEIR